MYMYNKFINKNQDYVQITKTVFFLWKYKIIKTLMYDNWYPTVYEISYIYLKTLVYILNIRNWTHIIHSLVCVIYLPETFIITQHKGNPLNLHMYTQPVELKIHLELAYISQAVQKPNKIHFPSAVMMRFMSRWISPPPPMSFTKRGLCLSHTGIGRSFTSPKHSS